MESTFLVLPKLLPAELLLKYYECKYKRNSNFIVIDY